MGVCFLEGSRSRLVAALLRVPILRQTPYLAQWIPKADSREPAIIFLVLEGSLLWLPTTLVNGITGWSLLFTYFIFEEAEAVATPNRGTGYPSKFTPFGSVFLEGIYPF